MKLPQFRLRTLFVVMAMFCLPAAWIGNQLMWIHERHAALDRQEKEDYAAFVGPGQGRHFTVPEAPAPWQLRIFGEQGVGGIAIANERPLLKQKLAKLFPEAKIVEVPDRVLASPANHNE